MHRPAFTLVLVVVLALGSVASCVAGGLRDRHSAPSPESRAVLTGAPGAPESPGSTGSITLRSGTSTGTFALLAPMVTCSLCGRSAYARTYVVDRMDLGGRQRQVFVGCCACLVEVLDDYARITSRVLAR